MPYLLRVRLPDVPGSLGRLAGAIGEVGADIEAIEIVEKSPDGTAVDDVLLEMAPGSMPDSVVSACLALDGIEVLWINRYAAGGNVFLDLEALEVISGEPAHAVERLVELVPVTFRVDWAAHLRRDGEQVVVEQRTEAAPTTFDDLPAELFDTPCRVAGEDLLFCAVGLMDGSVVVAARRGGPEFLDSELARLGHMASVAASIQRY